MKWDDSELDECWFDNIMSSPPPPPQIKNEFDVGESSNQVVWSFEESKVFETALAEKAEVVGTSAFFEYVATLIPSKSMQDIIIHFNELVKDVEMIEAGLISIPEYNIYVDNLVEETSDTSENESPSEETKKPPRRKGVAWTKFEHQLFLMGLNRYGKGDWRSIARYYVTSKTPTQIASHAQKYFRRQNSTTPMEKRRPSIHDDNTVEPVTMYPMTYTADPYSIFTTPSSPLPPPQMSFQSPSDFLNYSMTRMGTNPAPISFQMTTPFVNNYMAGMSTNATPVPFQMTTPFSNNYMAGMSTNATVPFQMTTPFSNNYMAGMSSNATPMPFQMTTPFSTNYMAGMSSNAAPMPFQRTTPYMNNYMPGMSTYATPMPSFQPTTGFLNNYMAGGCTSLEEDLAMFEQDPDMFLYGVNSAPHMPSSSMNTKLWC